MNYGTALIIEYPLHQILIDPTKIRYRYIPRLVSRTRGAAHEVSESGQVVAVEAEVLRGATRTLAAHPRLTWRAMSARAERITAPPLRTWWSRYGKRAIRIFQSRSRRIVRLDDHGSRQALLPARSVTASPFLPADRVA